MSSPGSGSDAVRPCFSVSRGVLCCSSMFLDLISSCRQRSCHWFCCTQFLWALRSTVQHFPTDIWAFNYFLSVGHLWTLGSFQRGLGPLGHCFSCTVSSASAAVGPPTKDWGSSFLKDVHCPHHTQEWASFYSTWIFKMVKSHCISTGVNGKCMSSEVLQKITFL